jgi:multidrug efflux pump subunit AcrA (membrane-fusion protein)
VLPDRVFHGQVTRVVHEADVQKNTLQVKVAIKDPTPEIKPEMLGRARFLAVADSSTADGRESNLQLFVPKSTVFERAGRSSVWLADQMEEVARLRAIRPGRLTLDDWVAVAEGLKPGDRVIVDAPAHLEDGQRILPVEQ